MRPGFIDPSKSRLSNDPTATRSPDDGEGRTTKIYWIHFTRIAAGQDRRFSLFEARESGARCLISAAGRIETPGLVVELLVRRGADPSRTCESVSAAIRNGVSYLTVSGKRGSSVQV